MEAIPPEIVDKAREMRSAGIFVCDISKQLSQETGKKISQMELWRLFKSLEKAPDPKIEKYEYPSREDIENLFSPALQREKNIICSYKGVNLRRNLMIKILENFVNKSFYYDEARIKLNDRDREDHFLQHIDYLKKYHYIELGQDQKFRFCERVKKWRFFGQL